MRYISQEEVSEVEEESSVWATMLDGTRYQIQMPRIENSKLVGYVEGEGYKTIALSEVESLGIKELNKEKTIILGIVGVAGAIILIWGLSGDGESEPCRT